jgi:transposase-like protein
MSAINDQDGTSQPTPPSPNPSRKHYRREMLYDKACFALARGASITNAAREAGVNERTLRRWLEDPDFEGRVKATREALFDKVSARGVSQMLLALRTLRELQEPDVPEQIRVRAAEASLRYGYDLQLVHKLQARVEALEDERAAENRSDDA